MTRLEAIEHGQDRLDLFGGKHEQFIRLAVKALKFDVNEIIKDIEDEQTLKSNVIKAEKNEALAIYDTGYIAGLGKALEIIRGKQND